MSTNAENANTIIATANRYGLPPWIPLDIARRESGLNENSVGDNGTSFGLFQLHRGGLAPASLTDEQLKDPATNADIAVRAMKGAYNRGVQQNLQGSDLLYYVANTSGWPGHLGVAWTQRNRPDYDSVLSRIYNDNKTEQYIQNSGGSRTVGGYVTNPTPETTAIVGAAADSTHYEDSTYASPAANTFRQLASKETGTTYKEWKAQQSLGDKLNPFSFFDYVGEQGTTIGIRALIAFVGLVCVVLALWSVVREQGAAFNGGAAPAAPAGGSIEGETAIV